MKIVSHSLLGLSLAVIGSSFAIAQDSSSTSPVPMILQISREYIKPFRNGAAHDKSESAFVAAETKAKFPAYTTALNSLSGRSRALFLTPYNSFAEWEKCNKLADMNATLSADLERAGLADGELLDEVDSYVYIYDADLSYHPHNDLKKDRVYQISVFHVRPGRRHEWEEVVKMIKDAHNKAGTGAHWGMYEIAYGDANGTYMAISGDSSMSAIDLSFSEDKKLVKALGDETMHKLDAMFADCLESSHSELFTVNPKQSYVSEDWIKDDPSFWRSRRAAAKPKLPAKRSGE